LCLFQKAGKETRFFRKTGFSLTQTANLPKLGLEEQSVKPQIKLSRGAENRLSAIELSEFELEALAGFDPVLPRLPG